MRDENDLPFDLETVEIRPSKHLWKTRLRTLGWSDEDIRDALRDRSKVERTGPDKIEVWVVKGGSKKIVLAVAPERDRVLVVTMTEGGSAP